MEIARKVNGFSGKQKRNIIKDYARQFCISEGTIYRRLQENGFGSRKKKRNDAGKIIGLDDDTIAQVAGILIDSWTEKYRAPIMPSEKAIELAVREGLIEKGKLSKHQLNRWLRNNGISKRDLARKTPNQRLRSLYPNHLHEYDVSVCAQWYIKILDESIGHQIRNFEVYKNKEGKKRIIKRHVIVDHCTGAFFVQYYEDETLATSLDFVFDAWLRKTDKRFIFRGLPEYLYTDQGNALRSGAGKQVCERLDIKYLAHLPGNARATGSGERKMWTWETAFETELKRHPAKSLEELNKRAFLFALKYNTEKIHSRHGMRRFEAFAKIPRDKLREIPCGKNILYQLATRMIDKRNIGFDGIIKYDGLIYKLNDQVYWGQKCEIGPDIFDYENRGIYIDIDDKRIKLQPCEKDQFGFLVTDKIIGDYGGIKDTKTQIKLKDIIQKNPEISEMKELEIDGIINDISGQEIKINEEEIETRMSKIDAKKQIMDHLGYEALEWQKKEIEQALGQKEYYTQKDIEACLKIIRVIEETG